MGKEGEELHIPQFSRSSIVVDIGIHRVVQASQETKDSIIKEFGLKEKVPFDKIKYFKYLLVVDGNTWPARYVMYFH
jgi:hypothetical protein